MYHPKFCPDCGYEAMESRCDAVAKCRKCDSVFVILDLAQVVKLHQTPAQIFVDDVVQALGRCTSASFTAIAKGGDNE